jgi:hypothetical protein
METQNTNRGVLVAPRLASQWLFGGISPIVVPQRKIANWAPFLPDSDPQSDALMDTMACLTFSGLHCIETQVNADIAAGRYPQATLDYFHSAGYMVNGKFKCSARYSAKMNGTSIDGNYAAMVAQGFATDGLLPENDLPFVAGSTFAQYYSGVTPQMQVKAKLIYQYITVQYQELTEASQVPAALQNAPIQVCTPVCPGWDSGSVVGMCSGSPQHATMIYGMDPTTNSLLDFDTYKPFEQKLASNYELIEMFQFVAQPAFPVFTVMKIGSTGANVEALQVELQVLGYFPATQTPTQYFGEITFTAVEAFQKANGLAVDGVWGIQSQNTLSGLKKN